LRPAQGLTGIQNESVFRHLPNTAHRRGIDRRDGVGDRLFGFLAGGKIAFNLLPCFGVDLAAQVGRVALPVKVNTYTCDLLRFFGVVFQASNKRSDTIHRAGLHIARICAV